MPGLRSMGRIICIVAGCAVAQILPARADLMWGVNGHPLNSYPGVSFERQLDLVRDLGARSYRVDVGDTGRMEPLARLVEAARPRGIEILPILIPPVSLEREPAADIYRKSYDFARAFAERFKDDIPVWELANELENYALIKPCEIRDNGTKYPCEWGPPGGLWPLDYSGPRYAKVAAVLRGLSDGVRAAAPAAKRALGTAGWGHIGIFERLRQDGIEWDITVWHLYGEDPEWAFKELVKYGKPIWVTEFNHPYGSARAGEQAQAEGLEKWMQRLRALSDRYRVAAAHIYELLDESYWGESFEAHMGLVRLEKDPAGGWREGAPKAAYDAVKRTIGALP
ncbi:glycosyl hydrolase [Chelatococcus sp. SYSU_G07232]|uniref:Glycosyl hydrolase n=1 Tax=Chelatococcus albus TaxID=3047466 RepID=A0ABT7ACM8_9HYPH|nr:glycosyl hydrolase [Chelatococcus sp. SYSU_G07232]MDJ1157088.1 glycosyl hydrolase [Chelatococcus sp. SYSU_G07232]